MSSSALVPIACRFVPYDQWFVTHLDDRWKVKQVKHWILAKCNLQSSGGPQTRRPVSPITFAPTVRSRSPADSLDDGYNEDDEYSEQDLGPHDLPSTPKLYPHRYAETRLSSQAEKPGCNALVDRYTLVSFSTGSMLEDEFALSWYNLRPYELLEMHPVGTVAPLQRDLLTEYIQPYFQAKIKFLRVVWNHRSGRFEAAGVDIQSEHNGYMAKDKLTHLSGKPSSSQPEKRHRAKINWKIRWVVINQGMLSLCKEHVAGPPIHQFALSGMTALCGADALERAFSIVSHPRVVCIRFRPRSASLTGVIPPSPSSSILEGRRSSEPIVRVDSPAGVKQATEEMDLEETLFEQHHDSSDLFKGEGEWVILDMLDDNAFSSILRILHREASQPISSSFAPSSSIIAVSPRSPDAIPLSLYGTIPYPEWRTHTVENARKAGIGDVGKAMAWVLWSEKGLGESLTGNIRHHRQAFLQKMKYKATIPPDIYGSNDESDEESEMEWEGWMRDLERQSRVKRQTDNVRRIQAQFPFGTSPQLPSPPPSASPRVRSPSLSMGHAGMGAQYRNIIHVAGANRCAELGRSPEKTKSTTVSTVTVGTALPPRRRSSTLSSMMATTKRDKGKQGGERVSSISVNSTRTDGRMVGPSAVPFSSSSPARHAHSSSNLRVSSPGDSDAGDLVPPVPLSPKGQSTFMRGVSLRASKIVRGLESAIDFVDDSPLT